MAYPEETVKNKNEEITDTARAIISALETAIESNIKESNFANTVFETLSSLIGTEFCASNENIKKGISDIWQQAGLNKESRENPHTRMNTVRKTIALVGKGGYNPIVSRAEAMAEEEMVHRKAIPATPNSKHMPVLNTNSSSFAKSKESWYKRKFNYEFEDFCENAKTGKNKFLPYFAYSKISREEVFCPLHNHRICTLDSIRVVPHSLNSNKMIEDLFELCKARLKFEDSLPSVEKILAKPDLSQEDLTRLEFFMRPGKTEHMHIINFMPRSTTQYYEKTWEDITEQAFVTGATIHSFNYPGISESEGKVEHKHDFVYAGLAMVNKLLDEGIHPSNIILQGYGVTGIEVASAVGDQFKRTGNIDLIQFHPRAYDSINSRFPKQSAQNIKELEKLVRNLVQTAEVKDKGEPLRGFYSSNLSYFQLLNIAISIITNTYESDPKLRGLNLPKERVSVVKGEVQERQISYATS